MTIIQRVRVYPDEVGGSQTKPTPAPSTRPTLTVTAQSGSVLRVSNSSRYKVDMEVSNNGGPNDWSPLASAIANGGYFDISGLGNGTRKFVRGREFNSKGYGSYSDIANGISNGGTDLTQIRYHEDFTGGTVGQNISTVSSLGSTATCTIAEDPLGIWGHCCKDHITAGNHTFGFIYNFGGSDYPSQGHEYWVRMRIYLPDDFTYMAWPWLKWFRQRVYTSGGVGLGYNDWYIHQDGVQHFIYEPVGGNVLIPGGASIAPVKGVWELWEMHVVCDTASVSNGGQARVDFWKNAVYLGSVTTKPTISNATDLVKEAHYSTYWNDDNLPDTGAPANQDRYIKHVSIATKTAGRDDTPYLATCPVSGLKFIGQ